MSELPLNEWIVIFYPQTGATRLCPTLDFAKNYCQSPKNVYKSPNDFRVKHDHHFLEKCWKIAYDRHAQQMPKSATGKIEDYSDAPPDMGTEEFARAFWMFLQDVGDRLSTPNTGGAKNDASATKENYELRLGKMTELMENEEAFKAQYNNQARIVFRQLHSAGKQFLNEDEIKRLIYGLVANRSLKTKQEPWVIFQYYRPQFIKDGYVIRGKRRTKKTRK